MNDVRFRACMLSFYFHPSYSGSAVQAANLSRHLRTLGVEALFVSANLTGSPGREIVDGFVLHRLPASKAPSLQIPSFWLSLAWFLICTRRQYDVVHAHGTIPHAIASLVANWLGKPAVLKIAMGNSDIAFRKSGRVWGSINRYLVRRFDRYVATSTEVYQECVARGLDATKIRTIPNGVDTEVFHPVRSDEERSELRRRLGLPNVPVVCYVGVIDGRKNLDGILRIWKRVRESGSTGHLLLVGPRPRGEEETPGEFFRELLRFISDNGLTGSVTMAGPRNDIPLCLRLADIFLFPSKREGMPNALLEALATGLACVASRIGGSVDIIDHGKTGYLFDIDDEPGMARAVTDLLGDAALTARIGAAARRKAVEAYSLDAIARRYVALYRELVLAPIDGDGP